MPYTIVPNIFLDIETVPNYDSPEEFRSIQKKIDDGTITKNSGDSSIRKQYWRHDAGGLSPVQGKTIMIAYQVDDGPIHRLLEWESSERDILKEVYGVFTRYRGTYDDPLNVIGFNIASFDLPFLYYRSQQVLEGDVDPFWLHKYFHAPAIHDIMLIHLPLNGWSRYGLNHNAVAKAYGLPVKEERGSVNAGYYYNREFDRILNYAESEFVYPEMYRKMKSGLVAKERLQECVRFFREKYAKERESQG